MNARLRSYHIVMYIAMENGVVFIVKCHNQIVHVRDSVHKILGEMIWIHFILRADVNIEIPPFGI